MWAPWGEWRSNPTSYAGVVMNYSMTPRQRRYINDYATEYLSEFRPNIFVTPRNVDYVAFPDYQVAKRDMQTAWQTPRVPPYFKGPPQNGKDMVPHNMISARSTLSRGGVPIIDKNASRGKPHFAPLRRSHSAAPGGRRRDLRPGTTSREDEHNIVEHHHFHGKNNDHIIRSRSSSTSGGSRAHQRQHSSEQHQAHLMHNYKPPDWRAARMTDMLVPSRNKKNWIVKASYDPQWKPLPNYSSAWGYNVPENPLPPFLPRPADTMPTGTDWFSSNCRTRQERAMLRKGF